MIHTQEKAKSLLNQGLIEALKKNYTMAISQIEEVQQLFLELNDIPNIAICLTELALIHYKSNPERIIRSLTLLNDAKALIHNHPRSSEVEAKIMHYYGIIYYSEKRYSEALKYFMNAQRLIDKTCPEYAKILDSLAIFYLRTTNNQVAEKYLQESLKCKQETGDKIELSSTKLIYGRYLSSAEKYDEARQYLEETLLALEEFGDNTSAARLLDELAKINIEQGNYEEAERVCRKSMVLAKEINAPIVYAFSCCTLANIKIFEQKPEEAISILENEVAPAFLDLVSVRGYALSKRTKAIALSHLGENSKSIEEINEAIELLKEIQVNGEVAKSYYELGKIYKDNDDIKSAISCIFEAFQIAKANNLPILAKKIEDLLYETDQTEWANIINKTASREKTQSEDSLPQEEVINQSDAKDPLISLLKIGRSIAAETDIDKLMEIIAEETKAALNADRCTVFLLDKVTNELWSKVALGMEQQEIRFPAHMGLAGHVASSGETINIKDAYNDLRFNKEIDKQTGYKTRTILCMPMRNINHEIIGVFQVLNKSGQSSFTDKDEDLLIAIGSSASIALENANLFKKQQKMYEEQKRSFNSFVNTLAASIDARDKITAGHSTRVTGYAITIARQMELSNDDIETLEYAALLHDFGKIGIKDSVLCKEGKLTDEEYKHIQEHAFITDLILKNMYFEDKFKAVPEIASSHHEKYNGTGYFRGTKGEEIPLGGRILAVADVFDAITSKRHYRDRMPFVQVLNILRKDSGSHFDGNIVEYFFNLTVDRVLHVLLSKYDIPLSDEEKELFKKYKINELHNILLNEEDTRTVEEINLLEVFNKHYNPPQE